MAATWWPYVSYALEENKNKVELDTLHTFTPSHTHTHPPTYTTYTTTNFTTMAPPHKLRHPATTVPSRKSKKSKDHIEKWSKAKGDASAKRASSAAVPASGAVATPVASAPEPKPAAVVKKKRFSQKTIEAFEELMEIDSAAEDSDGFYANASDSEVVPYPP
jgi:hypothetical protein